MRPVHISMPSRPPPWAGWLRRLKYIIHLIWILGKNLSKNLPVNANAATTRHRSVRQARRNGAPDRPVHCGFFGQTLLRYLALDRADDGHEGLRCGRWRPPALGDEAIVEAEPRRLVRQPHQQTFIKFARNLAVDRNAENMSAQDDLLRGGERPDEGARMKAAPICAEDRKRSILRRKRGAIAFRQAWPRPGVFEQILEGQARSSSERVTGGAEEEDPRLSHRLNLQLVVLQRAGHFGESKVGRALDHIPDRALPIRAADLGEYVRMPVQQDSDGPLARDICGVWARDDPQFANLQTPGERKFTGQLVKAGQGLVAVAQNDLAKRRGRHALS